MSNFVNISYRTVIALKKTAHVKRHGVNSAKTTRPSISLSVNMIECVMMKGLMVVRSCLGWYGAEKQNGAENI